MDYKKLGLKVGLEIHQQLSGKKLFCNCPAEINDTPTDTTIQRYLRATAGESGKVDIAAQAETEKQKLFNYQLHHTNACLVEIDEEPPHPMNKDALQTALTLAKFLKASIVDEVQVMRKIVVDGSNTTGFQRTALVAMHGTIKSKDNIISIPSICLEEDACKIVQRTQNEVIYNLSRLGIPLIEIATDPDIRSPEEAKEVAEKLGMFLRSTGKVKRGLGTIRQDLNVSIAGGNRIEMKGAQDLQLVPIYVKNEILRQQNLLKLKAEFKGSTKQKQTIVDISTLFSKTEAKIIKSSLQHKGAVLACKLEGFKGILRTELQPGRRFGSEVSDYAKIAAGVKGLFHSDELPKYGITENDVKIIQKKLGCKPNDAFILVAEQKETAERALKAAFNRAMRINEGVIKEVRHAKPDGTSSYLRPLPGAARMYPETDIPQIVPDTKDIILPELIGKKITRYEKTFNLSKDLAAKVAKSDKFLLFEELTKTNKKIKPAFIAETLVSYEPEILRNFKEKNPNINLIEDENIKEILSALNTGKLGKENVLKALLNVSLGKEFKLDDYKQADAKDVEKIIKEVIKKHPGAPMGLLMGRAMAALQGKADGKLVSQLLKKLMK